MKKTFEIEGMTCNHCVHAVHKALSAVNGVIVDHVEIGKATVELEDPTVDVRARAAIEDEGYAVVGETGP